MATLAASGLAGGRRWDRWLVGGVLASMAAVALLSLVLAATVAAGHALFHLTLGLVGAIPAALLVGRQRPTLATLVSAAAFSLLPITQLIEAIGAWGFAPDNDTVTSGIKALHDVGLLLSPIGLLGAVAGAAVGIGSVVARRTQSVVAILVALAVVAGGVAVVAKMTGL